MTSPSRTSRQIPHILVVLGSIAALGLIAMAHRQLPDRPSHFVDKIVHSLHGPGFLIVTFAVFALLRLYRRGPRNYFYTALIALGIAIFGEAAQIPGPRDAELSDIFVDTVGGVPVILDDFRFAE